MTTQFKDSLMASAHHPLTIKTAHQGYAAYAGIHSVAFNKNQHWSNADNWTHSGSVTFYDDGLVLSGSAQASTDLETMFSFVMTFLVSNTGQVQFRKTDANNYFYVSWSPTNIIVGRYYKSINTVLCAFPFTFVGQSEIRMMCREYQGSSIDDSKSMLVAVWVDGEYVLAASSKINGEVWGHKVALVCSVGSISWREEFSPIFATVLDWGSLDPGEPPMGGLKRSIGERYIRMFARYDGSLKVLRPETQPADITLSNSDFFDFISEDDNRTIVTHLRVWGAFHMAEMIDHDMVNRYGHRFLETNNPDVYTLRELQLEINTMMRKIKSENMRASFQSPYNPLIEIEDVVQLPEGKYIIESIDIEATKEAITMKIQVRLYVE